MNQAEQMLMLSADVRTPLNDPHAPTDWKDWYHFAMIDPRDGTRLLANVSLSGIPGHGQVIVSVIALGPRLCGSCASVGFVDDYEWRPGMVRRGPTRIDGPNFSWTLRGNACEVSVRDKDGLFDLSFEGEAEIMPIVIPELAPYGSGFIGWAITPQVAVHGRLHIDGSDVAIDPGWYCYHDHNYGRFRWGEDIGWIWFTACARDGDGREMTLVLHRGNNREQTDCGAPYLFIFVDGKLKKVFSGAALFLDWRWSPGTELPPRLPGAMATLFTERTARLPRGLRLHAADDVDSIRLDLVNQDLTELVLADNTRRQYTFIDEMTGAVSVASRLGGRTMRGEGYFYAEFVY